jgi:hypothetical protein
MPVGVRPGLQGLVNNAMSFKASSSISGMSFKVPLKNNMSFNMSFKTAAQDLSRTEPILMGHDEIRTALETFSVLRMNQYEFEEMFEEAIQYIKACGIDHSEFQMLETTNTSDGKVSGTENDITYLPLPFLIAGSESFRQKLLKLPTDPIFCTLMTSNLSSFIPEEQIRALSKGGKEREIFRIGVKLFSSQKDVNPNNWAFIVSGKLRVSIDSSTSFSNEAVLESYELGPGECFGGFGILKHESVWSHVVIETIEPSKVLELQGESLVNFVEKYEVIGKRLLSMMGGI